MTDVTYADMRAVALDAADDLVSTERARVAAGMARVPDPLRMHKALVFEKIIRLIDWCASDKPLQRRLAELARAGGADQHDGGS